MIKIYFCFLHSTRHGITLMHELDENDLKNGLKIFIKKALPLTCLLYTSPSPRDKRQSRMPSSA